MTARRHDARHPLQVSLMVLSATVAAAQLRLGPEGSRVLLSLPIWLQHTFAVTIFICAVMVLASMFLTGRRGTCLEGIGMFACAVALLVYAISVKDVTPEWITNPAFAYGCLGLGCAARAGYLTWGR